MKEQTDSALLRAYAEQRSEQAFAELIRRHVDFVYSAALRMVCDSHQAEDVAQAVFLALARNAHSLASHPVLMGWLHRTARNLATQTVRSEVRRRVREQEAASMNELLSVTPDPAWEKIAPHLDSVLGDLAEPDRDALLLRYFQHKSAREMAQILGISDEAAQKRVSRAVERLRELFAKRGLTAPAGGLVLLISAHAIHAAPAGLALTISAAAIAGALTQASTAIAATKVLAMTTLQKTVLTTIVAAGLAAPLVIQHQSQVKLRAENQSLREQLERSAELGAQNERFSNLLAQANSAPAPDPSSELLRLRGQVAALRTQTNELGKLQAENQRLQAAMRLSSPRTADSHSNQDNFPRESWVFSGYSNPESAILSTAWAALNGDLQNFLNSMTPAEQARNQQRWNNQTEAQAKEGVAQEFGRTKNIRILNRETLSENELVLTLFIEQDGGRTETPKMKMEKVGNEWKMAGPYRPAE